LNIQGIGVRISFLDGVESSLGFGKYLFVFFHFRNQLWAVNKAALSTRRVTWGNHSLFPFYPVDFALHLVKCIINQHVMALIYMALCLAIVGERREQT
jgi:hypothetical protein